ncbi:MAG TPA: hypothetical protein VNS55_01290 [Nocardioides sp.]|nr:hypothetical protein [Nocardioides sp.]
MRPVRPYVALTTCVAWVALTTGYTAAATEPHVDLGGTSVPGGTGSTDRNDPTRLEAGLWTDTLGDADSTDDIHYFRYDRRMQNSTLHVGVIGASSDDSDGLQVKLVAPDQSECDSDSASPSYPASQQTFGAAVWAAASTPDGLEDLCLQADHLGIEVERTTAGSENEDLPIAIKVVEEAPAVGVVDTEAPEDSPTVAPGDASGGDDVAGSASFADAPAVRTSGGHADLSTTVPEGEERLYRVPLSWGQQLTVEGRIPKLDKTVYEDERGSTGAGVGIQVLGPMRNVIRDEVPGSTTSTSYTEGEVGKLSTGTPPLRYLNRYDGWSAYLPGDYWISIAVDRTDPTLDPLDVPVDLAIDVTDDSGATPSYRPTVDSPSGENGPASYSPDTPFLVGPDDFSAVASGSPLPPEDADGGGWGTRRYAGLALVVAGAASCAAGVWRLRRAR